MLDFPSSPALNQIFTAPNGSTWMWDGVKWASTSAGTAYLPLSGGTMTGPLIQAADPVQPLGSATKQYVDAQNLRYRNRIINGDMAVDARNGGSQIAMPASSAYIIDRWKLNTSGLASKGNVGQVKLATPPAAPVGFPYLYALVFSTTTAYPTPAASDNASFRQFVEGCNFLDAQWGTPNALPVTVEFWVSPPVAGTYAVSIQNVAGTRCYVTTFTAPTGWTKVRFDVPGDTGGTWSVATNAPILCLTFPLCTGSTLQTSTLNAWQTGNFYSTSGATNVLGAVANFYLTGVALMVGAAAANAEPAFKSYADNLIDCQRYYEVLNGAYAAGVVSSGSGYVTWAFKVTKRSSPTTIVISSATTGLTVQGAMDGVLISYNLGNFSIRAGSTADADF